MSSTYLVPCNCGKRVAVTRSQAGQLVNCECGLSVAVPKLRDFGQLELAELPASLKVANKSWGMGRGIVAAIGLAFALACLANASYYLFWRFQIDNSVTLQDELREGAKLIDSLSPVETWQAYDDLQMAGLGRRETPPYVITDLTAKAFEKNAKTSGLLSLLGLAAMALAVYFPRRK